MAFNIIFMGTPDFAVPIFESLYNSEHKILCTYTQPPQKKDRGQKIKLSPVHKASKSKNITVKYPENLTDIDLNFIKKLKPDLIIVVAYGNILPKFFFDIDQTLFINIHASLLPKWRGAAPIQRAIMNLDKETGITIMKMVPKLDSGPILTSSKIKIDKDTSFQTLSHKLSNLGARLLLKSLTMIEEKKAYFKPQNDLDATYAKKINKKEAEILWSVDASKIIGQINALSTNPGSWFNFNGSRVKILKATQVKGSGIPGEIIKNDFTVACLKNAIRIEKLKKEGKKEMNTSEFLKGNKIKIGQIITN